MDVRYQAKLNLNSPKEAAGHRVSLQELSKRPAFHVAFGEKGFV